MKVEPIEGETGLDSFEELDDFFFGAGTQKFADDDFDYDPFGALERDGGSRGATGSPPLPDSPMAEEPMSTNTAPDDTRTCPYCAESIKAAAILCRYCQRESPPSGGAPAANVAPEEAAVCPVCGSDMVEQPEGGGGLPGGKGLGGLLGAVGGAGLLGFGPLAALAAPVLVPIAAAGAAVYGISKLAEGKAEVVLGCSNPTCQSTTAQDDTAGLDNLDQFAAAEQQQAATPSRVHTETTAAAAKYSAGSSSPPAGGWEALTLTELQSTAGDLGIPKAHRMGKATLVQAIERRVAEAALDQLRGGRREVAAPLPGETLKFLIDGRGHRIHLPKSDGKPATLSYGAGFKHSHPYTATRLPDGAWKLERQGNGPVDFELAPTIHIEANSAGLQVQFGSTRATQIKGFRASS